MLRGRSLTSTPPKSGVGAGYSLLGCCNLQSLILAHGLLWCVCVGGVTYVCIAIEARGGGWEPSSVALHCVELRRDLSWTRNSIPARLSGITGMCGCAWLYVGMGGWGIWSSCSLTFPASILTHSATSLARAWVFLNPFSKCVHFPSVCRLEPTQCRVYSF